MYFALHFFDFFFYACCSFVFPPLITVCLLHYHSLVGLFDFFLFNSLYFLNINPVPDVLLANTFLPLWFSTQLTVPFVVMVISSLHEGPSSTVGLISLALACVSVFNCIVIFNLIAFFL